jgi:hypothetical protein
MIAIARARPLSRGRVGQLSVAYLVAQSVATVAWWIGLGVSPGFRAVFDPAPQVPAVLQSYLAADLCLIAVGSAWVAWAVHAHRTSSALVASAVAGGLGYATLTLLGWQSLGGGAPVGTVVMLLGTVVTGAIAVSLERGMWS